MAAENPKRCIILVGTPVLSTGILNEYKKNEIGLLNERRSTVAQDTRKNQNIFGTFFPIANTKNKMGITPM